jgi:hypothetical protein
MPEAITTTTTDTSTSIQSGIGLVVDSTSSTKTIGNYVTDVSLQPYIANRIISFVAYNLRPSHRLYVHFDGINVSEYCAPGIIPTGSYDTSDYNSVIINGNWGDPIYSDSNGRVAVQFNIPANTFKTGDRIVEITNVDNLQTGFHAIVMNAQATFTASNLSVSKQAVTLTTVTPIIYTKNISSKPVITSTSSNNTVTLQDVYNYTPPATDGGDGGDGGGGNVYTDGGGGDGGAGDSGCGGCDDPVAQALSINITGSNAPQGTYVTALDLYFKQKSLIGDHGVSVYLCEVNNGYPDASKILPFSTVHLMNAIINISDDASIATKFSFEAPIFLNNNKEYSFIVKADQGDTDFLLWSAELGSTDVTNPNIQVFSQPVLGTAFEGATMYEWSALQKEYVKFTLYRASFTESTGTAVFNNSNTEYINIQNLGYTNSSVGILSGDYIYSAVNSTPSTVNTSIYGKLSYFDNIKSLLYVDSKTSNPYSGNSFVQIHRFVNTSVMTPNSTTLIAYANTTTLYNPVVDATVAQFATLQPGGTTLSFGYTGTSNSYTVDSSNKNVNLGYETELYDKERIVASKSNEINYMSGQKSMTMTATLTTDSQYLSPIIDTVKANDLVISNQIDPVGFIYNEYYSSGNSKSKYVSQIVTLAKGQDAEDLQLILSASRPPGTDIQVFVRFLNGEDSEPISNKIWTPMVNQTPDFYTSPSNMRDFKEFVYTAPYSYNTTPTTGTVTVNTADSNVIGTSTLFNTELNVGYWVTFPSNTTFIEIPRQVISITNNTLLTLNSPFTANHTSSQMVITPPPTAAILSNNSSTLLTGNVSTYTTNNSIVGSGTLFLAQLSVGSIIEVDSDKQVVISITNNTLLSVGEPWSSNNSGANAYAVTTAGVTYLNSANNLYTNFLRFQTKIIIQSNDSSKVPIIDDMRALALQL